MRHCAAWLVACVAWGLGACGSLDSPPAPLPAGDAAVTAVRDCVYLHNAQIVRTFALRGGAPRTVSVANRVSGGADLPVNGPEFVIVLGGGARLTDADCTVVEWSPRSPPRGPAILRSVFRHDPSGLRVEVRYELASGRNLIRKRLDLSNGGTAPLVIDRIELEHFRTTGPATGFDGPGQPVYVGDLFWGCEHPGASNEAGADGVRLGILCGETLRAGQDRVSCTSVTGAGHGGRVQESFFDYIEEARRVRRRPFRADLSRFDVKPYDEDQVVKSINGFSRRLVSEYATPYQAYVLDEGWDTAAEPWKPDPVRFPAGLSPLKAAAEAAGAALGVRLTASGGFGRSSPAAEPGVAPGSRRCLAEPATRALFLDRVRSLVTKDGVCYLRLDDFAAPCNAAGHGHRAGPYAQAASTDAVLEVLKEIRKARPDVFILLGDGFPLSPWWLIEADALWRGDGEYGFADIPREAPRRELFVTFVDAILYRELQRKGRQVPLHALSTGAVVQGRLSNDLPESHGTVGEREEFMPVWERMVVMEAARGTRSADLHLSYAVVTRDQWRFLSRWLAWSEEKADLLARGGMAGGDPGKGEPYAFVHGSTGRAILAVRNPSDREKDLVLRMDAGPLRFAERTSLQWKTVYPDEESGTLDAAAAWTLRLKPFEVRVLEVWSREP